MADDSPMMCQPTSIFSNVIFSQLIIKVMSSAMTRSHLPVKIQRISSRINFISVPAPTAHVEMGKIFSFGSLLKPDDYKRFDRFTRPEWRNWGEGVNTIHDATRILGVLPLVCMWCLSLFPLFVVESPRIHILYICLQSIYQILLFWFSIVSF